MARPDKPAGPRTPMNAKLKRHMREKARRSKLMRQRPATFKDKFVSGCLMAGLLSVLVFIAAVIYSCAVGE